MAGDAASVDRCAALGLDALSPAGLGAIEELLLHDARESRDFQQRNTRDGGDEVLNPLLQRRKVGRYIRLHIAQFEAERNQALLRTIVQIAFDTPPRMVSCRDDAGP